VSILQCDWNAAGSAVWESEGKCGGVSVWVATLGGRLELKLVVKLGFELGVELVVKFRVGLIISLRIGLIIRLESGFFSYLRHIGCQTTSKICIDCQGSTRNSGQFRTRIGCQIRRWSEGRTRT